VLNKNNFSPRILYSAKLSFTIDGGIKIFHEKQKLKQYMTTKPLLQKILHIEDESKQNHRRTGSIKPQEKKRQVLREQQESSIDSTAHNQILKQQKQLNIRNPHILININTEWTSLPRQKTSFTKLD
jgi:hypothetical protein